MHAVQLASSRGLCGCFMCNILAAAGGPVAQSPAGRGIKTTSTRPAVRSGTRRGAPLSLPLLPVGQSPTSSGVRGAGLHGDHCDERRATCHPQRLRRRRRPARHNAAADYMPTARAATWTQPHYRSHVRFATDTRYSACCVPSRTNTTRT